MHIKEVDEQLDYETFMDVGLPDDAGHGEYTQALGRRTWELKHGLAKNYGCVGCKDGFVMLESAEHDVVNINLGKGVYDPKKFQEAVKLYDTSLAKWKKEGMPLHRDSPYSGLRKHHLEHKSSVTEQSYYKRKGKVQVKMP